MASLSALSVKSLLNRRFTSLLAIGSIALSVALLLGVERVRSDARLSFANTVSGVDLIVGARTGSIPLLLYSVFHIGSHTNDVSWESYEWLAAQPAVNWAVPISLGDSHRGFPLLGTSQDYFEHYRYGAGRQLELQQGELFSDVFDVVVGAEVAEQLGYEVGDEVVIAHGAGEVSLVEHDDKPFHVSGILRRTGTPVDRTLYVSLEGIEAMHVDWEQGMPVHGHSVSAEQARDMHLEPEVITAALLGLKSPIASLGLQRAVNLYEEEPLLAILPGVALQQLWDLMSVAERALLIVSVLVVATGLVGMMGILLASLNERRREMAILRSVGARPLHVFSLLLGEAATLVVVGVALGVGLLYACLWLGGPVFESRFGLALPVRMLSAQEVRLMAAVVAGALLVGLVPAVRAYRHSLADGMSIRI
jgi:putative ABC transport system permease protein